MLELPGGYLLCVPEVKTKQPQREIAKQYWWIALYLSAIAGSVDGIGYLLLAHIFTSHMSGNTVTFTIDVASGNWKAAWRHLEPIAVFFAGALLGMALTGILLKLRFSRIFGAVAAIEAAFLVVFLLLAHPAMQWMVLWPAAAMGIQNALLRRVGGQPVRTTFITGMLATAANKLASCEFAEFAFYASIWICFAAGGITGAFIELRNGPAALLEPIAALALLGGWDAVRPITRIAANRA